MNKSTDDFYYDPRTDQDTRDIRAQNCRCLFHYGETDSVWCFDLEQQRRNIKAIAPETTIQLETK